MVSVRDVPMNNLYECPKCRKLTLEQHNKQMICVNPNCDMVMKPQDESNLWYTEA